MSELSEAIAKADELSRLDEATSKNNPHLARISRKQRAVLCSWDVLHTTGESLADDIVEIERHIYFREYGEALELLRDVIKCLSTHASVDVSKIVINFNKLDEVEVQNSDSELVIAALANIRDRNFAETEPLLEKLIKQFGSYPESFGD